MMVYNTDVRRNTRQFKKLAVMSEANAPKMTAAAIEEAQALQSEFFSIYSNISNGFGRRFPKEMPLKRKAKMTHFRACCSDSMQPLRPLKPKAKVS